MQTFSFLYVWGPLAMAMGGLSTHINLRDIWWRRPQRGRWTGLWEPPPSNRGPLQSVRRCGPSINLETRCLFPYLPIGTLILANDDAYVPVIGWAGCTFYELWWALGGESSAQYGTFQRAWQTRGCDKDAHLIVSPTFMDGLSFSHFICMHIVYTVGT